MASRCVIWYATHCTRTRLLSLVYMRIVVFAVDIISAIEFDRTGDHLATGDRGGRVVLFERTDTKDVSLSTLFRHICSSAVVLIHVLV